MKRTNTLTLAALAMLSLAGCTQDDERTATGLPMTGTPMRVVAHVDAPVTREAMTTNDLTRYYFRVTDADGGTDEYNYFTTMKLENGQWSASQEMTWQSTYPKVSAMEQKDVNWSETDYINGKDVSVQADQSDRNNLLKSDLLYMAPKTLTPADLDAEGNIKVDLAHRFAKLKVVVNVTGTPTNPISALTIGGTQTTATFIPETDELEVSGEATDITAYRDPSASSISTEAVGCTATYECILLPQELEANTLEVTAIMDEGNKSYTHAEALTLNSNYQYTLTLNMAYNGTMKPSGDVNVGTWGDEEAGSGELKEEEGAVIEGGTYYVSTARGLQEWAQAVAQGGGRDPNLILTDDIDMRGKTWPNTGVYNLGTIDGRGYTIKNLTLTGDYTGIGLISGFAANSSIKNLTLLNPSITSDNAGGFFIGSVAIKTTMENCHVIGGTAINADMTGCLAHSANESSFTACSVTSSNVESMINSIPAGEGFRSQITACYVTGGNLVGSTVGAPIPTYTASYYQESAGDIMDAEGNTVADWNAAAEKMNEALENTSYEWVVNSDKEDTNRPLVIKTQTTN